MNSKQIWNKIEAYEKEHNMRQPECFEMVKVIAEFHRYKNVRWSQKGRDDYDMIGERTLPSGNVIKEHKVHNYFFTLDFCKYVEQIIEEKGNEFRSRYVEILRKIVEPKSEFDLICASAAERAFALYLFIKKL